MMFHLCKNFKTTADIFVGNGLYVQMEHNVYKSISKSEQRSTILEHASAHYIALK